MSESTHKVKSISWNGQMKILRLHHKKTPLYVPGSACVSKGDEISVSSERCSVICNNGFADILPTYIGYENLQVGQLKLQFVIKEITEEDEQIGYGRLQQLHYRSEALFGRTARLVMLCFHPLYPRVVGYIELASPFFMSKPRSRLFDSPFTCGNISWKTWDKSSLQKNIHVVIRIARCVISPEFRGLSLGTNLLNHAFSFARSRWQVAGLKPLFVEMSADMLKYVPFASNAGMHYIGETEGNVARVADDLHYLLKNIKRVQNGEIVKKESCGIVDKQISRMNKAVSLMNNMGWDINMLIDKLHRFSHSPTLKDYNILHQLLSLPKPTYMAGLVPEATRFLSTRLEELNLCQPKKLAPKDCEPINKMIKVNSIALSFSSNVRRSNATTAVQKAFGISPTHFSHEIISELSFDMEPGDIVLITGSSGSGKTSLLKALNTELSVSTGTIKYPQNFKSSVFKEIRSQKPLIEVLSNGDVTRALQLLGTVGLSDAFVYFKRFSELSNGQQYRAMLASMLMTGANVWFIDEFCANLDHLTAVVVANRLQRVARDVGAILIAASSQPESFVSALKPSKVIRLHAGVGHEVIRGKDFMDSLASPSIYYGPQTIEVTRDFLKQMKCKQKISIIKKGRVKIKHDWLVLSCGKEKEVVRITHQQVKPLKDFTNDDALKGGFVSLAELHSEFTKHYPSLKQHHLCSMIEFDYPHQFR